MIIANPIKTKYLPITQTPKDLQKQNFYDAVYQMRFISGWEILEEENFLALKSPHSTLITYVWGEATYDHYQKAKSFFGDCSFSWILTQEQDDQCLMQLGFTEPERMPEMILDLNSYQYVEPPPKIDIIVADSGYAFQQWVEITTEIFNFAAEDITEFFVPLIQLADDIPLLALYEGEPAATSMLYCKKDIAGVYAVATRPEFRRKGLGSAITHACLKTAKNNNFDYSVLYASPMGELLYEKIGFHTTQILREYHYFP